MSEGGMERIRVCLACGELAPFEERTCPACGHDEPIEGQAPCPGCGAAVASDLIFCPRCGMDRAPAPDWDAAGDAPPLPTAGRWGGLAVALTLLGPLLLALAVGAVFLHVE